MALPTLDATFASAADLPRRYMLAQWLVNISYSGSVADYVTLPEQYLWAKIAVAAGASRGEADYISLPKQYIWKAIYDAVSGSSNGTIDWGEKQAVGHIAAAYRGDTANPANLATYIDWPWRYQVASVITHTNIDTDAQAFITTTSASDKEGIDQFVKGVKNLGLWSSMVCWPLRSSQNSGGADPTNTTVYSLGGLGAYNGTRVNGPTWGVNGVNFNAQTARIAVTAAFTQPLTIIAAANFKTLTNGGSIIDGSVDRISLFNGGNSAKLSYIAPNLRDSSNNYTAGVNIFGAAHANGANTVVYLNGTANTAGNGGANNLGPEVRIGNNVANNFGDKNLDVALVAIFTNQTYNDAVRALYKATLGTGLGLP